jgi:pimeloyl-ACP methyl ester carboxylesterase
MTPLYFGSAQRRLFGVYTPPRPGVAGTRAALLCYPWGQEYIRAHRSMRQLANMLCAVGYHVLRFDYYGTGDSAGESQEADLGSWGRDIETAIEELRDTSGVARVRLVGLRLGATLAARVAARKKKEVDALLLWDPVVNGPEYLRELLPPVNEPTGAGIDGTASAQPQPATGADGHEVLGFRLPEALAKEMGTIDLLSLVPALPARARVISSLPLASHLALRAELDRHSRADVAIETVDGLLAWRQYKDLGAGAVPTKVLETMVRWLG